MSVSGQQGDSGCQSIDTRRTQLVGLKDLVVLACSQVVPAWSPTIQGRRLAPQQVRPDESVVAEQRRIDPVVLVGNQRAEYLVRSDRGNLEFFGNH